jgi:Protein of unknown function (DUF4019)
MKLAFVVLCFIVLAGTAAYVRASDQAEDAGQAAALAWLQLVDAGNYSASWDAASSFFRQHVSQSQWQTAAANARAPFGALKSRKLQSARFTRTVPGAPDGQYVIVTYASTFENKAGAVETLTPMADVDGAWRVSGYYIR